MRQLSSLDAQFLAMEDGRTHGHVSFLGVYEPRTAAGRPLDAVLIRELVTERVPMLPPFRWRLAAVPFGLDHPYWVDAGRLDLTDHVHERVLPAPGDSRQLAEQVSQIIAVPLDRSRPLWEIHVMQGLADGAVAVLIKMHHAAVDGVSGAEVMNILLDGSAEERSLPTPIPAPVDRDGHPSEWEMLGRGLLGMWRQPLRALRAAPRTLPHLDEVPTIRPLPGVKAVARNGQRAKRLILADWDGGTPEGSDLVAPRTRFQDRVSAHRSVAFGSLALDEVKAVKTEFGCTVNDVVVTLCASGLRSWLLAHDELPSAPLVAFVPVSVRTAEQRGSFGNRVSVMIAELPTDEPDPLQRLRRVSTTMKSAKQRHRRLPASLLQDANHLLPPALFSRLVAATTRLAASRRLDAAVNVAISNVPGPSNTLYLGGAEQRAQYPISGVLHGVGLNITVVSYRDALEFGIVVDRDQLDDPWPLLDALRDSLAELRAHTRDLQKSGRDCSRAGRPPSAQVRVR